MKFWLFTGTLRQLRQRKFRPIFRFFTCSRYRADILQLARVLSRHARLSERFETMRLRDIYFSHEVHYPEWVKILIARLRQGEAPPPIKVIHDGIKYVVADGNHRLLAMIMTMDPEAQVVVRVLYPEAA